MKLHQLFEMQRALDTYIQKNHQTKETFTERGLALLVELSELANETRCFKFWSTKGPSADHVILEEYVDSIHFLLSLGIEKNFDGLEEWPTRDVKEQNLTQQFIQTGQSIYTFLDSLTFEDYKEIWVNYGALANTLGFTEDQIIQAYIDKNEENYARQRSGY
ncbi:dUTPase [Sporosarcina sp. P21c]|uniref:dUTP diphosphatase n=1 Tax=unclassified Sporosarcina TaxID=2647733 RepID=UPI000C169DA4|nr:MULTISPECIES: dUTP diphosphatase [unclassified Sporosarcina]PIC67712.1 dUTPase [Sporosarcina sp. P16a]PIC90571.1 dUTPase [Sporosarcina sp. P21c]PIC93337.1 dUTPase [Sporosarcina sp. P25]